jgi:hypothetical protein
MGKMKWRYLKKYYGRLSLRWELVHVFRYMCRQLRLTHQECFLMLLLLFADIGRWLSPEGVKRIARDVYRRLFWGGSASKSPNDVVSTPLKLGSEEALKILEEELRGIEARVFREEHREQVVEGFEVEEESSKQQVKISNEEVRNWLAELNYILSRLLIEYYTLLKENEKLKKKSRELKTCLDKVMDYIMSHDPELYIKVLKLVDKKLYTSQGYVKNRKVGL